MKLVRRCDATEIEWCTVLLARAFSESTTYRALLPGMSRVERDRAIQAIKRCALRAVLRDGELLAATVERRTVGVALVLPPCRYPFSLRSRWELARGVLRPSVLRSLPRFLRLDAWTRARHPRAPHYYLYFMGVDPAHQGTGVGGALLREITSQADRVGAPIWLETARDELVRYYGQWCFRVVHDEVVELASPLRMRTMIRAPRDRGAVGF